MNDILQLARELHEARLQAALDAEAVRVAREKWEAEHFAIIQVAKDSAAKVSELDTAIRTLAVSRWENTGEKKIVDGVDVKVGKDYIFDADEAFAWAQVNARVAILPESLDKKVFLGLCKDDATRPGFVTVEEKPTATIATDLGKFYGDANGSAA
jgi:uncharacterized protein (UPF0212 family)